MSNISEAQHFSPSVQPQAAAATPAPWTTETVSKLWYWTPRLLSFRVSRSPAYRFDPGHYARVGLADGQGEIVWRPLSMVSAPSDPYLEFVVALVPGGAFSALVGKLRENDPILVESGCFGFLTVNQLAAGKDLWLLASGTGIGPFVSILREPATWRSFDRLVVAHSVRHADELVYRQEIETLAAAGAEAGSRASLRSIPVVTREPCPGALPARIPQLIADGRLEAAAGTSLDLSRSRVMVCGNPDLGKELRALFTSRGFQTNRRGVPGQIAFEKYW